MTCSRRWSRSSRRWPPARGSNCACAAVARRSIPTRCYCCACRAAFSDEQLDLDILPPRCAHCDGLVRPDVVLFGEMLPTVALSDYEREVARGFDVLIAIGTTAGFPYIAEPMLRARRAGAVTVEINPDKTVLTTTVTHRLAGHARDVLLALDAALSEV